MLLSNYYTLYDDLESLGYTLISLINPDATCFIKKLEGPPYNLIIEAKEAFLRSSWDPPVAHLVHFINSVRSQR